MTQKQITHLQDMIDDFFSETHKKNNNKGKTGAIKRNKNK